MNLCRLRTFPTSRDVRLDSGLRPKADFRRPLRVYVRALSATPWEMTGWILAFLGHVDRILEALHGKECERGRRDHRPANWRRAQALFEPKPVARRHDFLQRIQGDLPGPVLVTKIFRLTRRANQNYDSRHPVPLRGALAIVTNVGAGCGGRGSVGRESDCRAALGCERLLLVQDERR